MSLYHPIKRVSLPPERYLIHPHSQRVFLKVVIFAFLIITSLSCLPLFSIPSFINHWLPSSVSSIPSVTEFLSQLDHDLTNASYYAESAQWQYETNITQFNLLLATQAQSSFDSLLLSYKKQAAHLDLTQATTAELRQIQLLLHSGYNAVLNDPLQQSELSNLIGTMQSIYGSATYNGEHLDPNLTDKLATSRDYDELINIYIGWRNATGPKMRPYFIRYIELSNLAAQQNGFTDMADQWLSNYEMNSMELQDLVEDLWDQILPLYEQLHCHVRRRLITVYGSKHFDSDNLIPAHLLGNMWGQSWNNIADIVLPFPDIPSMDLGDTLRKQGSTPERMHKIAENFYVSLGLPPLPETFWDRSMLTKPDDGRDVICHASAWDIDMKNDVRIKMCTTVTTDDFITVHHEQGHLYYDMLYAHQPYLFREGAHDGFHEAIGDTIALSITPTYLTKIGLISNNDTVLIINNAQDDVKEKMSLNNLMRIALDKLAFLPFGYLVDKWRWEVARGTIRPDEYTSKWWDMVRRYQGMKPPKPRSDEQGDFDAGSKYHVASHVPYLRYFFSHLIQFQLYRSGCRAAGYTEINGTLHECSIYQSKEAGEQLMAMLQLGSSRPWTEALAVGTGGREWEMDTSALLQYFEPLIQWLREQNQGQTCSWT